MWPCPLLREGLGDKWLPWLPAKHLAGKDEFILCLHNQLFNLATSNLVLQLCDICSLQLKLRW
jgi:hypothetical protein